MTFHEILNTLLFHRKKIFIFTALTAVFVFLILLFVYPITYSSEVKVLPPEEQSYGALSGLLGGSNDISSLFGLGSSGGNSQLFVEILKSRSASEYVFQNLNLTGYFDEDNLQKAVDELQKLVDAEVTKEGIILLRVPLKTPLFSRFSSAKDSIRNLAAEVSNKFIEALDVINREKLSNRAKKTRIFIEQQIQSTLASLDTAENELKIFQEKNKTISLPEQLAAAIDNAAKIKSEIIMTDIKLRTLEYNMLSNSQEVQSLKKQLEVLKESYAKMEGGEGLTKDYLPVFENVPEISLELARLMREVKIQNEVYLLLQTQYYHEKIQENRDIATVEILDPAIPALKPSSPRLAVHTLLAAIFAFLFISALILYSESKKRKIMGVN